MCISISKAHTNIYTVFIVLFIVHAHAPGMPESFLLGFHLRRFHHAFRLARHVHMCGVFRSSE